MQPVYLTEDGNYAIADNSSDDQENQENKALQKSRDGAMEVQDEEASSLKQVKNFCFLSLIVESFFLFSFNQFIQFVL